MIQFEEAVSAISSNVLKLDINDEELYEIEERINSIELMKRRYGGSIESVVNTRKTIELELNDLQDPENFEKKILDEIDMLENIFYEKAIKVHQKRKKKATDLSKKIEEKMKELNMPDSQFIIKIKMDENADSFINHNQETISVNSKGIDIVEFYLSANLGEPAKPLSQVASGGEISRIMLAIKTVFHDLDPIDTLVFDEIDSGISGNAAKTVAKHLVKLSKNKQVICITHLPQIAQFADNHLHIEKYVKENHTFAKSKYLDKTESLSIIKELFLVE